VKTKRDVSSTILVGERTAQLVRVDI